MRIIDVSDELWMWYHWKYGINVIVRKLYSFGTNNWCYLAVPEDGWLNWQNHKQ